MEYSIGGSDGEIHVIKVVNEADESKVEEKAKYRPEGEEHTGTNVCLMHDTT